MIDINMMTPVEDEDYTKIIDYKYYKSRCIDLYEE
jgi:hypothetical protein